MRGALQGAPAAAVGHDLLGLILTVAQPSQGDRNGLVDDLEIAPARQLFELHEREVGLDAGRVAVHHQADRAGRGDDGGLRVAVAVLYAHVERLIPCRPRGREQVGRAVARVDARGRLRDVFVFGRRGGVGRAPVVADDAEHVLFVGLIPRERPEFRGDLGACRVGAARP